MNLEGVLAISGKPGLFKLVAQSRGGIIVESMADNKRFAVSSASNVSALKDIALYTYGEEVPLRDVFQKIAEKENYRKGIDPKSNPADLKAYMGEILPAYDQERVYVSDIKKVFQWYNLLHDQGYIVPGESQASGEDAEKAGTKAEENTPE